jgi:hypothetical protein
MVAVATPCWPAPVSAMMRGLPMRLASMAWPMVLLILCAPVWFRSSRFEINLRAAHFAAHAGRVVDGRGAADKMRQLRFELGDESRVVLVLGVGLFELFDGVGQRLADKTAAVNAKVAAGVGLLVGSRHGFSERVAAHGPL